jgi:hypothetical protein
VTTSGPVASVSVIDVRLAAIRMIEVTGSFARSSGVRSLTSWRISRLALS